MVVTDEEAPVVAAEAHAIIELVEVEPGHVPGLLTIAELELELSTALGGRRRDPPARSLTKLVEIVGEAADDLPRLVALLSPDA